MHVYVVVRMCIYTLRYTLRSSRALFVSRLSLSTQVYVHILVRVCVCCECVYVYTLRYTLRSSMA